MSNSSKLSYQELSDMLDNVAAELRNLMIDNNELIQEMKYLTHPAPRMHREMVRT